MVVDDSALSSVLAGPDASSRAEPYDFGRPAALSREHARTLGAAFDAFARQWALQLTSKARVRAHISVERVTMETYEEYAASVPAATTLLVCALAGTEERGILQFPLSTALAWVVKTVGGDAASPDPRPLTAIEQALLRALLEDGFPQLRAALGDLLPGPVAVAGVQYSAAFAQVATPRDLVVVARLSLRLSSGTVSASVVLPAAAVRAGLSVDDEEEPAGDAAAQLRRQVEETPVEMALRLVPRRVQPGEVLGLRVGDVLPLPHPRDRPLDLAVDDHVVATAAVGTNGARLACVVTSSPRPAASAPAEESA